MSDKCEKTNSCQIKNTIDRINYNQSIQELTEAHESDVSSFTLNSNQKPTSAAPVRLGNVLLTSSDFTAKLAEKMRNKSIHDFILNKDKFPKWGTIPRTSPVDGIRVSSPYGVKRRLGGRKTKLHQGIDYATNTGTPIKSTGNGIVVFAGRKQGYGKVVIIRHPNGINTIYAHLHGFKVKKGQKVKEGQIIALSGNSGTSTGPHLHYEVRKNDKPVDPMQYINHPQY